MGRFGLSKGPLARLNNDRGIVMDWLSLVDQLLAILCQLFALLPSSECSTLKILGHLLVLFFHPFGVILCSLFASSLRVKHKVINSEKWSWYLLRHKGFFFKYSGWICPKFCFLFDSLCLSVNLKCTCKCIITIIVNNYYISCMIHVYYCMKEYMYSCST